MTIHDQPLEPTSVRAAAEAAAAVAATVAAAAPSERAAWLRAVANLLDHHRDDLAAIADEETALGLPRLTGEVGRTTGQLRMFADVLLEGSYLEVVIDQAEPDATPPRPDLRRMLQPLGPVAVFAAGNFPFAFSVVGGDTASALAAGCPVVVKAHPGHPRTSRATGHLVVQALRDAGAPVGTFGVVEGFEAGKDLVVDPAITAVGFTGSLAGGRALFDLATSRPDPIPFYGELGSLNPVVISPQAATARTEELASGLVGSFTLGVGQFCTKPGVVFVPDDAGFEDEVAAAVTGADRATMLYDGIAERFDQGLRAIAANGDVEVVAGDPEAAVNGRATSPVVLATTTTALQDGAEQLLEECFGPMTLLVRYRSQADLEAALTLFPGSLTATIHAEPEESEELTPVVEALTRIAGRVIHGGWPTGVAVTWSQHHGGPWPATTAPLHTSVGATAIRRFLRPVAYQDLPEAWLPDAVRDANPWSLPRRVDGQLTRRPGTSAPHE
jgi:NADP-dependent aldehyde dehydrogenase